MPLACDHLVEVAENPLPPGGGLVPLVAADGVTLRAAYWPGGPRGTVLILPGRSEFIEKYGECVGELQSRGFGVLAMDWRGQGGSERLLANPRKGHVDDFAHYRRDLDAALDHLGSIGAPRPWFALAHSMGGAVLAHALCRGESRLNRAVLSAPMFGIVGLSTRGAGAYAAAALNLIGLGGQFVPRAGEHAATVFATFAGNPLTSDERRYLAAQAVLIGGPDLAIGAPTVSWVAAALRLIRDFEDPTFGLKVRCPMLVLAAGADSIVSTPAIERITLGLRGARSVTIPGARHEILMERDGLRGQALAAIDAFIRSEA